MRPPESPSAREPQVAAPWTLSDRAGAIALAVLVPGILVLDYLGGRLVSLQLFYLVPTALAAWIFGARVGYAVAVLAGIYWAAVGFGLERPQAGNAAWLVDAVSTLALFAFVAFVVARHRRLVDQLVEASGIDMESGAISRREFARLLEAEVRRARRYKRPLALAVFDAASERDWPKKGARFLPAVVRTTRAHLRDSDAVGRVAERRLGVILVECPVAEALRVGHRVREQLGENLKHKPPGIGVATYTGLEVIAGTDLVRIATEELERAQAGTGLSEQRID